jgi:hypothetical protein
MTTILAKGQFILGFNIVNRNKELLGLFINHKMEHGSLTSEFLLNKEDIEQLIEKLQEKRNEFNSIRS